jgi:hypothetical protein
MTKEEKITQAYGKHYELCKPDEDGWTKVSEYLGGYEFLDDAIEYFDFNVSDNWRPLSLYGIENNNGWIKINSESDLPEQGGEYIVFRMSKKSTATYCKSDRWMVPENDYPKTTFKHGITHYRKKEIIPNPIY